MTTTDDTIAGGTMAGDDGLVVEQDRPGGWWRDAERVVFAEAPVAVRRLSACVVAGALVGLVVGGIGGRLAMLLLARLNPAATGVQSDDDFRMGQFTTSGTLNLLVVGVFLGLFGGIVYAVVRGLRIGPRWFEIASLSIGSAVVVGSTIVHVDGVDFTLLDPPLVAIALFVAIPGLYTVVLTLVAERWLEPGRWPTRWHPAVMAAPLLPLALVAPIVVALIVGWALLTALRHTEAGAAALAHPAAGWLVRAGLTVVFVLSLVDLVDDTLILT